MIQPITRDEIINGLGQDYYCYMFGLNHHKYKCDMWLSVFDEVGGIGFLARDGGKIIGQLIFIPKKYARRLALPTSPHNRFIDKTMVIACLYVLNKYHNRGIASEMIRKALAFCRENGYTVVEAPVDPRPVDQLGPFDLSFNPFKKFGFKLIETREGWEFRPDTRICFLDLQEQREE